MLDFVFILLRMRDLPALHVVVSCCVFIEYTSLTHFVIILFRMRDLLALWVVVCCCACLLEAQQPLADYNDNDLSDIRYGTVCVFFS